MGKNGQSALAGVQRQLVGQLVKYRRTTRLRLNKCLGDDLAPPLPAAIVATPICRYPKILIRGSLSPR